ncbi:leucine-rich repeat protein [Pseudobacteroides cellulosolvens]|uniref:Leucine rich repeat 5 n=1 Tax=Pseudobacteroides cellulosolvens ATCC 35603 = DSM 2933 TaxID=398512 RepID=A0A0L6JTN0_9FIRM|nr:leucine-rich repeat protein [Pseudobacteroides cellulosolvens]KNY29178.1 Leucine rich repeat 5 [Pseudobacteroides cellulosolvens ATCC 35603 = DSM 2933]
MKAKKTFIYAIVISIITIFFVQFYVTCNASTEVDPEIFLADVNGNGIVNMTDVIVVAVSFNSSIGDPLYSERLDLDKSGTINMGDLIIVAKYFNQNVPIPTPTVSPYADYDFDSATGTILKYKGPDGDVIIPDMINEVKVTSIGKKAFYEREHITSIKIPDSVNSIGACAFLGCDSIKSIEIPDSVTSIDGSAFALCFNLTSIKLSKNLTYLGSLAFETCSNLTSIEIPYGIKSIESSTFYRCFSLTNITIPDSVTSIGKNSFAECKKLRNISMPKSVEFIDTNAFIDCINLSCVTFPGNQPTNLGENVFANAPEYFRIIVSPTATGFGKPDPYNNEKYWSWSPVNNDTYKVVVGNSDSEYDFDPSTGTIYGYMGSNVNISIPNKIDGVSVNTIGDAAFFESPNILSVSIPGSATTIKQGAFASCPNLNTVTIPNSVISIGDAAFSNCPFIKNINLPDSLQSIGAAAFMECGLTDITIPANLKKIGDTAFSRCPLSNALFMGNEPTFNVSSVFYGVKEDFKITVLPTTTGFGKPEPYNNENYWEWNPYGNLRYRVFILETSIVEEGNFVFGTKTGTIIKYNGSGGGDVVIPDKINDVSVTSIGDYAFYRNDLSNIQIPQSVTNIHYSAFYGCISLEKVELPQSLKILGKRSFERCSDMREITIPDSLTYIDDSVFSRCRELKIITIPKSVTRIGNNSYEECSFGNLIIPEGVTSIGSNAFHECNMTSITLPNSLTYIGSGAFSECSLSGIRLPESIKSIGDHAFSDCSKLTGINLPDNLESIGNNAFSDCYKLTDISLPESLSFIGNYAFSNCNGLTSITIPKNVDRIWTKAFSNCNELSNAIFLGDQPADFSVNVFEGTKEDFKITVMPTAKGFGKPEPYNNELSWIWGLYPPYKYTVVVADKEL